MIDLNSLDLDALFETLTANGSLDRVLRAAIEEDLDDGDDVTTAVTLKPGAPVQLSVTAREAGVVAGLAAVPSILEAFKSGARFTRHIDDGDTCRSGDILGQIEGEHAQLLTIERTLLNLLGRMCGIATITRQYVEAIAGTKCVITDTRKTTPALRSLEKYAVRCGGATLHRAGLYDAMLIKDNHLVGVSPGDLPTFIEQAVRTARKKSDLRFVEVEVDTNEQLKAILQLEAGLIDIILLDNMTPEQLARAVALRDQRAKHVLLEASGNITLETIRTVANTGVDRIAVGALTHSATSLDIGLDAAKG